MVKISKSEARKRLAKGENVYMLPSKAVPGSIWIVPALMDAKEDFDWQENVYRYYCCLPETGMAVRYWVEEG